MSVFIKTFFLFWNSLVSKLSISSASSDFMNAIPETYFSCSPNYNFETLMWLGMKSNNIAFLYINSHLINKRRQKVLFPSMLMEVIEEETKNVQKQPP